VLRPSVWATLAEKRTHFAKQTQANRISSSGCLIATVELPDPGFVLRKARLPILLNSKLYKRILHTRETWDSEPSLDDSQLGRPRAF
jgi:hypothetical protein